MKLLEINVCSGKLSTGRIVSDIATEFIIQGNEAIIATSYDYKETSCPVYVISNKKQNYIDGIKTRLFDNAGFNNKKATIKFVKWIKGYNPDIIHLHNLHGYYINIEILFNYLETCNKRIIWTLHDCWAFTGHCAYFDFVNCDKWKSGCKQCVQKKSYPKSILVDRCKINYRRKKKIFCNIPNMTIATPSQWLSNLVKKSFLKDYPVVVINNGIDLNVFQKTNSDLKEKFNLVDKKIILAVAGIWDRRKGFEDVLQLNEIIDESMKIVMIGLNDRQLNTLPSNILGIKKTDSVQELAQWYSTANVLINPTYEDNYPTVNLEAQACGCPVISYETGGSVESTCNFGLIAKEKTAQSILEAIKLIDSIEHKTFDYSINKMVNDYINCFYDFNFCERNNK